MQSALHCRTLNNTSTLKLQRRTVELPAGHSSKPLKNEMSDLLMMGLHMLWLYKSVLSMGKSVWVAMRIVCCCEFLDIFYELPESSTPYFPPFYVHFLYDPSAKKVKQQKLVQGVWCWL